VQQKHILPPTLKELQKKQQQEEMQITVRDYRVKNKEPGFSRVNQKN
jgi:hypothetical protein